MAKEFSSEKVVAALNELGYNQLDTEAQQAFLADADKCRELVGKVQGTEAIKRNDAVYRERYKKRAERMVQEYMSLQNKSAEAGESNPVEAGPSEAEAAVVATTEANTPETPPEAAPVTQEKTMAKKASVAKTGKKKKAAKPAKEKVNKGPGVIDTIVSVLQGGGGSVTQIAEKVHKKFSDRELAGILATVKIQMTRLMKPKTEGGRALKIKREKQEGTNELLYSA